MTKKHFKLLAAALRSARPNMKSAPFSVVIQWEQDCQAIADACRNANAEFDREKFFDEVGVEK